MLISDLGYCVTVAEETVVEGGFTTPTLPNIPSPNIISAVAASLLSATVPKISTLLSWSNDFSLP